MDSTPEVIVTRESGVVKRGLKKIGHLIGIEFVTNREELMNELDSMSGKEFIEVLRNDVVSDRCIDKAICRDCKAFYKDKYNGECPQNADKDVFNCLKFDRREDWLDMDFQGQPILKAEEEEE